MGSFANLSANLKLNIQNFSQQLRTASNQAKGFAATLNGTTVQAMQQLNKQTSAWGLNMKSVSRVVSGIVISQAFYRILQSVQQATNAVWEFTKQLEYAHIAYSNLFGDTELASEFINVLKDFAALTPFGFVEAEKSAKRLLAYGIEYKNVMYVMQGVLAASAAQGDSMKIEQISRALGQIYTYGKLMTAEVRQLTEAGIPVYDILQEKLGLTQEQLRNLGKEAIPASVAINAIVDGINERFGNVLNASNKTISGIISNIKDNATMLFAGIFEPMTVMIKSALYEVGQFFYNMREIMETSGIGGVFEAMFPPELHDTLRIFIANLMTLGQAIARIVVALGGALKPVAHSLILVFNAFAPVLITVANLLSSLIIWITENAKAVRVLTMMLAGAAAMWVAFKVKAIAAAVVSGIIKGISKALAGLSAVLNFVVMHPFWALLIGLTGVIVGISGGFGALTDKVNNFFKSLTKFNGVDPDKVLLPSQKDRANDLEKFNQKLDGTSDAMDDLADSTGKATKAAKGLLSFDEVFKLNEPDEGAGSGGIDGSGLEDLGDLGLGGLGDSYVPEIPDFSEYMDNLKTGFVTKFQEVWQDIKDNVITAALGGGLGAVIGGLIGGPAGAKIGAAIGALAGWIWSDLADKLGLSDYMKISLPLGTLVGTAIGAIAGGPAGAVIGSAVGTFVGWLAGLLAEGISEGDATKIATPIGALIGAGIGFVIGGPAGAGIGAAIGALVSLLVGELSKGISENDPYKIATPLSTLIGAGIGFVIGGPGGAVIGSAIGGLVGMLVGTISDGIDNQNPMKIATPIGTMVGAGIGLVMGGPIGAGIGAAIGTFVGWLAGKFITADWSKVSSAFTTPFKTWGKLWGDYFTDIWEEIKRTFKEGDWLELGKNILLGILKGIVGAIGAIGTFLGTVFISIWKGFKELFGINSPAAEMEPIGRDILLGVLVGIVKAVVNVPSYIAQAGKAIIKAIGEWFTGIGDKVSTWMSGGVESIKTFVTDSDKDLTTWASDTYNTFSTWKDDTFGKVSTWSSETKQSISDWSAEVKNKFSTWSTDTDTSFGTWSTNIKNKVTDWSTNTKQTVNTWSGNVRQSFTNWSSNNQQAIETWSSNIKSKFTNWSTNTKQTVSTWSGNVKQSVSDWSTKVRSTFDTWSTNVKSSFSTWSKETKSTMTTWSSNVRETVSTWWTKVKAKFDDFKSVSFSSWASKTYSTISGWASDVWSTIKDKIGRAISKIQEFFNMQGGGVDIDVRGYGGHATGGIFNREHIARFAEGNKAEAVIPLENASAMQPFVDAISKGILEGIAPALVQGGGGGGSSNNLQPLYVGTLIADDRGLKQLYKKFELIQVQENARKGFA